MTEIGRDFGDGTRGWSGGGRAEPGAEPRLGGQHVPDLPRLTRIGPGEPGVTVPEQIVHVAIQRQAVDDAEFGQGLSLHPCFFQASTPSRIMTER